MILEEAEELGDVKTSVQNSIMRRLNLPGSCGKNGGKNGGKN